MINQAGMANGRWHIEVVFLQYVHSQLAEGNLQRVFCFVLDEANVRAVVALYNLKFVGAPIIRAQGGLCSEHKPVSALYRERPECFAKGYLFLTNIHQALYLVSCKCYGERFILELWGYLSPY